MNNHPADHPSAQALSSTYAHVNFGEEVYITDWKESLSRSSLKRLGAKLIAESGKPQDELKFQLWQLVASNGEITHWIGDDWYSDSFARVYLAHKAPF